MIEATKLKAVATAIDGSVPPSQVRITSFCFYWVCLGMAVTFVTLSWLG